MSWWSLTVENRASCCRRPSESRVRWRWSFTDAWAMTSAVVDAALALTANLLEGALAKVPEDQWFERESAWVAPRDLAAPLVAMANADGGVSVVGMHGGVLELSIRG